VASLSFNSLFFNSIETNQASGTVIVSPNFLCPKCGAGKVASQKTASARLVSAEPVASVDKAAKALDVVDFNKAQVFTMPCCGAKITLYLAVYKGSGGFLTCISTEPIDEKWYVALEVPFEVADKI
jgi:hypothetical protein